MTAASVTLVTLRGCLGKSHTRARRRKITDGGSKGHKGHARRNGANLDALNVTLGVEALTLGGTALTGPCWTLRFATGDARQTKPGRRSPLRSTPRSRTTDLEGVLSARNLGTAITSNRPALRLGSLTLHESRAIAHFEIGLLTRSRAAYASKQGVPWSLDAYADVPEASPWRVTCDRSGGPS